jgi:SAM-dependent methyltransferase
VVEPGWDALADTYAERLWDELDGKPLDRAVLQAFAAMVRAAGPRGVVADVGCGPGHVTRFLADCGLDVVGIDIAPRMVAVARQREPTLRYEVGSVLRLAVPDATWAGAVALYSLIHFDDDELATALGELHRAVRPGGLVLVSVHSAHLENPGEERLHLDELWGHAVDLDVRFIAADVLASAARGAGFAVEVRVEREPIVGLESTRRATLLLRRP